MVLAYILIGIVAGFVSFVASLFLGTSILMAFGIYTLVGFTSIIVMSVIHIAVSKFAAGTAPQADEKLQISAPNHAALTGTVEQTTPLNELADKPNATFKILAVDDERFILDLVKIIGRNVGDFNIVTASSGAEALDLLTRTNQTFDYLLFDISMPEMSGIDLCRQVRAMPRYRKVPLVMLTAMRDMEHISEAFRAGATDYATKPFDIEELGARLKMANQTFKAQAGVDTLTRAQVVKPFGSQRSTQWDALIDHLALSNYLTLLSPKDMGDIQIFAIKIDRLETLRARFEPSRMDTILESVAAAVTSRLDASQTVMAYTKDGELVIATSAIDLPDISQMETSIAQCIQDAVPEEESLDSAWAGVSIGYPVPVQGAKNQRAELAIRRALESAENRVLSKNGQAVIQLPQASGN
jgi:CheY-like chemotaxis protein